MSNTSHRRAAYLNEMGLGPLWVRRDRPTQEEVIEEEGVHADAVDIPVCHEANAVPMVSAPEPTPTAMPPTEVENDFDDMEAPPSFFDEIPLSDDILVDIDEYVEPDLPEIDEQPAIQTLDWQPLETRIQSCQMCGLCTTRTQAVPGVGDQQANWLFIGEGPGQSEDAQGEPFVGVSGKLLDNILQAMKLKRGENVYIANMVKCRASDQQDKDRAPTPEEVAACRPYLDRQIALIQPKVIVALGRVASVQLLQADPKTSLASLRGQVHQYQTPQGVTIPLIATYHPAYLLRQLRDKKKSWGDMCLAMRTLKGVEDQPNSDR